MPARLRERFKSEVVPALMRDQGYTNVLQVPKLEKIVLNMGLGEAVQNPKLIDAAVEEIATIAGQKPVVTRSRKANSNEGTDVSSPRRQSISTVSLRAGSKTWCRSPRPSSNVIVLRAVAKTGPGAMLRRDA